MKYACLEFERFPRVLEEVSCFGLAEVDMRQAISGLGGMQSEVDGASDLKRRYLS